MTYNAAPADAHACRLLVVDDDDRLRDLLQRYLSGQGYRVDVAHDAAEARKQLARLQYDLIVLDVTMPGEDGFKFARAVRDLGSTPILFLTARKETPFRIEGLEAGADDYMGKPFDPRELSLRVAGLLRRMRAEAPPGWFYFGEFRFDLERHRLWNQHGPVLLSARESQVLAHLARASGEPVSREQLAGEQLGRAGAGLQDRSVDVCISRLRRKLGEDAGSARHIVAIRGRGYALRAQLQ